jgi:CDP-glucose 4,6-dehydratase
LLLKEYKGKNVFVTGHTGFKGSWLTLWLEKLGASVAGYALDPKTEHDNFVLCNIKNSIREFRADIRDKEKLFNAVKEANPEIIFHLAAQPLVLESYQNPSDTFETNIQGTVNMLEAFRLAENAKLLIVITTDKVYENKEWEWGYRENDRLGGTDPYSASKSAVELVVRSYNESFYLKDAWKRVVTVRAGNVIGGGDWSENRIIPDCIKAIENNKPIILRNPGSVRPWQHVLEPLRGYLLLGEKILKNEIENDLAWNFGPDLKQKITVEKLVQEIICLYKSGSYEVKLNPQAKKETNFLSLDIAKAISKLKWKPVLDFHESAEFTVEWYKNYRQGNVKELCLNQIDKYTGLWNSKN